MAPSTISQLYQADQRVIMNIIFRKGADSNLERKYQIRIFNKVLFWKFTGKSQKLSAFEKNGGDLYRCTTIP